MKKILFFLSFLAIGAIVSCKKDNPKPAQLTAISLAKDTTSLNVGDTKSIAFTLTPSNFDKTQLVWHSSDNSILTVDNTGAITGLKEGEAVVTVTNQAATITSVCLVYVMPQLKAITLTQDTLIMHAGDVRTVGFTVTPANSATSTLVWQSSDTTILKVSSVGAVTAKIPGEAVVSVTSQDGLLNKNCLISVLPALDPLAAGLIAYYPFNNSGHDLSGNGNDGTVYNITSVPDRNGKANSAYHFDGLSSYIAVADNQALRLGNTDFTLSAWVNLDSYNTSFVSTIISKRVSGINNGWLWALNGNQNPPPLGGVYYGPGGGNADAVGSKVLVPGTWYMVTCVYTKASSQVTIYVNGVPDQSVNGILPANSTTNVPLYIGKDGSAGANGYYFQGSLDDIRIYGKALSAGTVQQLYNAVY
jgi:hypothetical protein